MLTPNTTPYFSHPHDRHRHVPKAIKKAAATKRVMLDSEKRRKDNKRKHSKPGTVPYKAERQKHIVQLQE